jgi:hypothetical protein
VSETLLLASLPFSNEQIDGICARSDVIDFIECYSTCFDEDEANLFVAYVHDSGLLETAAKLFAGDNEKVTLKTVGTLKHVFAYGRVLSALAGRDSINAWGIPYLMEADADLACSLLLTREGHFKQSAQILRSALEAAVIHAYFTISGVSYDDLSNREIPPLKDQRHGMLNRLITAGLLCSPEAGAISNLYQNLSAATHSHYKYLTVRFEETFETEQFILLLGLIRRVSIACLTIMLNMMRVEKNGQI